METQYPVIAKPGPFRAPPNLECYDNERARFRWDDALAFVDRLPGGWNITHEAIDRHVSDRGDQIAIWWLGRKGDRREYTYAELSEATSDSHPGCALWEWARETGSSRSRPAYVSRVRAVSGFPEGREVVKARRDVRSRVKG